MERATLSVEGEPGSRSVPSLDPKLMAGFALLLMGCLGGTKPCPVEDFTRGHLKTGGELRFKSGLNDISFRHDDVEGNECYVKVYWDVVTGSDRTGVVLSAQTSPDDAEVMAGKKDILDMARLIANIDSDNKHMSFSDPRYRARNFAGEAARVYSRDFDVQSWSVSNFNCDGPYVGKLQLFDNDGSGDRPDYAELTLFDSENGQERFTTSYAPSSFYFADSQEYASHQRGRVKRRFSDPYEWVFGDDAYDLSCEKIQLIGGSIAFLEEELDKIEGAQGRDGF